MRIHPSSYWAEDRPGKERAMYEVAVCATVVLTLVAGGDYVRRAWVRETSPVLATWILMLVMMGLSFAMYMSSPRKSWTGNIGVVSALANVAIILVGVVATNLRDGTLRVAFDATQKRCLFFGAMVAVLWSITQAPLLAYILVQVIAVTACFATVRRLWRATSSTEPIFLWAAMFCAGLCALYPAWTRKDVFAWIYLARAIPSTFGMICLIARIGGSCFIASGKNSMKRCSMQKPAAEHTPTGSSGASGSSCAGPCPTSSPI